MKAKITLFVVGAVLFSCGVETKQNAPERTPIPLVGTWQLISGTTIESGDTTVTSYTDRLSFIKIINDTHFAFLKHSLLKGKQASAEYDSGGGRYVLKDSLYTEYLDYCTEREWEGTEFNFTVTLKNDTLLQEGIEKVEKAGINRLNRELYVRVKK